MHDQDDLIEKKLDGTLTATEAERFERLLRTDPAFAQAYATQQEMVSVLRQHHKKQLHQQLEVGYQQFQSRRRQSRPYYYGAAAVLLLVITAWWWKSTFHERLFATYYQPYEVTVFRRPSVSLDNQATVYYSQGRYAEAVPLLQSLRDTDQQLHYWALLLGNAYLQLDSLSQARQQLERVSNASVEYSQYARWYLALSYLKDANVTEARTDLQRIARQPGLFQKKAQQLLKEL